MSSFSFNSLSKTGIAIIAAGLLAAAYSATGPSTVPQPPPVSQGGQYNQQYLSELEEFPAVVAHHSKVGWIGDRLLLLGGILLIAGLLIPSARKTPHEK